MAVKALPSKNKRGRLGRANPRRGHLPRGSSKRIRGTCSRGKAVARLRVGDPRAVAAAAVAAVAAEAGDSVSSLQCIAFCAVVGSCPLGFPVAPRAPVAFRTEIHAAQRKSPSDREGASERGREGDSERVRE
jgi:hypothetical protein